jgi:hypothetical protein
MSPNLDGLLQPLLCTFKVIALVTLIVAISMVIAWIVHSFLHRDK